MTPSATIWHGVTSTVSDWRTALGSSSAHDKLVAGYPLVDLITQASYVEVLHLVLRHELPDARTARLLQACLNSVVDHGVTAPFSAVTRFVAANNPDVVAAVAAGILAIGPNAGGAQAGVVRLIDEGLRGAENTDTDEGLRASATAVVLARLARNERIPGIGTYLHKVGGDERANALRSVAGETGHLAARQVRFMEAVAAATSAMKGASLPMNIDGLMGALFAAMGFDAVEAAALEVAVMLPMILGHTVEELHEAGTMRMLPTEMTSYVGPPRRPFRRP